MLEYELKTLGWCDVLAVLTKINTDDLALNLLLTTFCRVPPPEGSGGNSGGRGASESRARELKP